MRIHKNMFLLLSGIILFTGSITLAYTPSFSQPTNMNANANTNQINTTDIDSAIVNMLNQISRGNVIDSTMNTIISGMNVDPNQAQNQSNQVQSSSLNDINSIIASNTSPYNEINQASNSQPTTPPKSNINNEINKFTLKVVNKENDDETIIKSNSLTEFNNELIKFCTTSSNIYSFECISSMQNSIQAADFTSNYMGPTKLITNLDQYELDLIVR